VTEAVSRPASQEDRIDVAIGGGGLSGHLMALVLADAFGDDLSVAVFDPAPRFGGMSDDPRAYAISAASQMLLETVGVWDAVAEHAQPIREIRLTDNSLDAAVRKPLLAYDNAIEHPLTGECSPASYIVPNAAIADAVVSRLLSHRSVRRVQAGIDDLSLSPERVDLSAGGAQYAARLMIAADGARSRLRGRAGIKVVRRDHRQKAIVTIVAHDVPHQGVAVQHFLPAGPFAILPMVGNRSCVTWSEDARRADAIVAMDDADFLAELDHRFGAQLGELRLVSSRKTFPLATQIAREMTANRFALIGDAAHAVHPIGGQGLNLAIRDIAALAECIADAQQVGLDAGDASVLSRYARWRRFDNVMSATAFASLNRSFSNDFALLRSAREFGLSVVDRIPGVKQRLVDEAAGLSGDVPKLLRGMTV
jgi:2-octaprenyl-6-methoxyphenol hydroxylase